MKWARCIANIIVYINTCINRSPKVGNYFQQSVYVPIDFLAKSKIYTAPLLI